MYLMLACVSLIADRSILILISFLKIASLGEYCVIMSLFILSLLIIFHISEKTKYLRIVVQTKVHSYLFLYI